MKATEQCFPMVLFIMLYKVVLTFESVDEILKCDHLEKNIFSSICNDTNIFKRAVHSEIFTFDSLRDPL